MRICCAMLMAVSLSAALSVQAATRQKTYPAELAGTWMIQSDAREDVPRCKASDPIVQESEATMTISAGNLQQYESGATPRSVRRIATRPAAWEIQQTEENADGTRQATVLYVLQSDRLTVFEDDFALFYQRCL